GVDITAWSIRKARRFLARTETLGAAQRVAERHERVVPQPQVEGQLPADPEVVLHEPAGQSAAPRGVLAAALDEPVHLAQEKIGERVARKTRAAETKVSILAVGIDQINIHL